MKTARIIYTDLYTNDPIIKCFICNISKHDCRKDQSDNSKFGWSWICGECRISLKEDEYMDRLKDDLSKKYEERTDKILAKPIKTIANKRTRCKKCTKLHIEGV